MMGFKITIEAVAPTGQSLASASAFVKALESVDEDAPDIAKGLIAVLKAFMEADQNTNLYQYEAKEILLAAAVYAYAWDADGSQHREADWDLMTKCNAMLPKSLQFITEDGKGFKP